MSTDSSQKFCLRWHNYSANVMAAFEESFNSGLMTDVTLFLDDGRKIKCHKMVLAATSEYFRHIFMESTCKHPMVFLNNIEYPEIKAILEFMYRGEVNVEKEQVPELLKLAEFFKVEGLFKSDRKEERASPHPDISSTQAVESNHNEQPEQSSFVPPIFPPGINPLLNSPFTNDQLAKQWIASLYSQHLNAAMMAPMPPSPFQAAMNIAHNSTPKQKMGQSSPPLDTSNPILRNVLATNQPAPPYMMNGPLNFSTPEITFPSAPKSFVNHNSGNLKTSPNHGEFPQSPSSSHSDQSEQDSVNGPSPKGPKVPHRTKENGKEWKRYKQYSESDINLAIQAVKEEGISALQASRKFKVPSRTLYDKVKKMGLNVSRAGKRKVVTETVNNAQFPVGIGGNANGAIYNNFPILNAPLAPDAMNNGNEQFQLPTHDSPRSSDSGSPGSSTMDYPAPMVMINGHVEVAHAQMLHHDDDSSEAEDLSVKKEVKAEGPGMEMEDA